MSSFSWEYIAELENIVDGDTFDMQVDLGFHAQMNVRIRLAGVDTAEIYGVKKDSEEYKKGKEQTEFVRQWFEEHEGDIYIETFDDEKGKYGRWLARVYADEADSELTEELLDEWPEVEYNHRKI